MTDEKHVGICIFFFNQRDSTMRPPDELSVLPVQSPATTTPQSSDLPSNTFIPEFVKHFVRDCFNNSGLFVGIHNMSVR